MLTPPPAPTSLKPAEMTTSAFTPDHRATGVVYHPGAELWGNYVPTEIPRRYNAFLFMDETRAVDALHMPVTDEAEVPETYPSGM